MFVTFLAKNKTKQNKTERENFDVKYFSVQKTF